MFIETERLELIPLTPRQLRLWVEDISTLEKEISSVYRSEPMEGFFLEIVRGQINITEADSIHYMWHSFWLIVRKEDRSIIGSADFKDVPDPYGDVEIGYGLGKEFEHNGYMTETVKVMCNWALNQSEVNSVIAETEMAGLASQRILARCGFKKYKETDTFWWRVKKEDLKFKEEQGYEV